MIFVEYHYSLSELTVAVVIEKAGFREGRPGGNYTIAIAIAKEMYCHWHCHYHFINPTKKHCLKVGTRDTWKNKAIVLLLV